MVCSTVVVLCTCSVLERAPPDIKATTAILTLVACLLVVSSFTFSLTLLIDWVKFLTRPRPKANDQEWSGEEVLESARRLPLSTRTLGIQTAVMSCLAVWLIAVLVPSTLFARTRSAHLNVRGNTSTDLPFGIDTRYWDYGFRKCTPPFLRPSLIADTRGASAMFSSGAMVQCHCVRPGQHRYLGSMEISEYSG